MAIPNESAALAAFWQQWNGSQLITDPTDAEKHRFTAAFAAQLAGKDPRWGRKSRPGNAPISKDTLGYWLGADIPTVPTDGTIDAFDLIGSDGRVSWDLRAEQGDSAYANVAARWYPVVAADPPHDPPPQNPPPVDLSALLSKLNEIGAQQVQILALLQQVLDKPDPIIPMPVVTFPTYRGKLAMNLALEPDKE